MLKHLRWYCESKVYSTFLVAYRLFVRLSINYIVGYILGLMCFLDVFITFFVGSYNLDNVFYSPSRS
jgi:hypothetical protein